MRCPDCNKFVSMDTQDPEVESLDISADDNGVAIDLEVRIVRVCADCGTELKEATLGESKQFTWKELGLEKAPEDHGNVAVEERSVDLYGEVVGRKARFGATVTFAIVLDGEDLGGTDYSLTVKCEASEMEEMV